VFKVQTTTSADLRPLLTQTIPKGMVFPVSSPGNYFFPQEKIWQPW